MSRTTLAATLDEYRRFAVALAREAGEITLRYFQKDFAVETKADMTPVTRADREAEAHIRAEIARAYPEHGVLGEESGYSPGGDDFTWVVDPIDGTKSYIAGVPLYTVLIALIEGAFDGSQPIASDRVVAGVIHAPAAAETVSAARGCGAVWSSPAGESVARTAPSRPLESARIATTDFGTLSRERPSLARAIDASGAMTRTWGDAYGYLLVATGRIDAMIDPLMNPWDVAPLPVIIAEAGGTLTDLDGRPVVGTSVLAASDRLHATLLAASSA